MREDLLGGLRQRALDASDPVVGAHEVCAAPLRFGPSVPERHLQQRKLAGRVADILQHGPGQISTVGLVDAGQSRGPGDGRMEPLARHPMQQVAYRRLAALEAFTQIGEAVANVEIIAAHRQDDADAVVPRHSEAEQRRDIGSGLRRGPELLELVDDEEDLARAVWVLWYLFDFATQKRNIAWLHRRHRRAH